MATDKLELYNGALLILKERSVTLTESRQPRLLLDDVWGDSPTGNGAVKACLEAGNWKFAKRTVRLDYSNSITPSFGYRYAFIRPPDYVRMLKISADEYFNVPLNQYEEEGDYFFSPANILYLQYVSNDASYGADFSKWPESFTEYVKNYLAWKIVGRLTGSKIDPEKAERGMEKALAAAQGKDAIGRPTAFLPRGTWTKSRQGRSTNRDKSDRYDV